MVALADAGPDRRGHFVLDALVGKHPERTARTIIFKLAAERCYDRPRGCRTWDEPIKFFDLFRPLSAHGVWHPQPRPGCDHPPVPGWARLCTAFSQVDFLVVQEVLPNNVSSYTGDCDWFHSCDHPWRSQRVGDRCKRGTIFRWSDHLVRSGKVG